MSGNLTIRSEWQYLQACRLTVKPWINFDMSESRGREESFGLKYPSIVGWDPDCFWAVLIHEPLNLFFAFNSQKALVYN